MGDELKDALAFYDQNGYLQPFQCDIVVERLRSVLNYAANELPADRYINGLANDSAESGRDAD